MSSLKPVIHGRDHLPGGADPIPQVAAATATLAATAEVASVASTSIIAASVIAPVAVDWAHVAGASLLDYTTPSVPVVTQDGVYAVSVNGVFTDMAPGARYAMNLIVLQSSVGVVSMTNSFMGDSVTYSGGTTGGGNLWVGGTFVMTAASFDSFELDILNNSNLAVTFESNYIEIVRIG